MESMTSDHRMPPETPLDTTFANGAGVALIRDPRYFMLDVRGVAIDSERRIYSAFSGIDVNRPPWDWGLIRFTPDGMPDTSFADSGDGFAHAIKGGIRRPDRVQVLPDGRILVTCDDPAGADGFQRGSVAVFTSDGYLDESFGDKGVLVPDLGKAEALEGVHAFSGGGGTLELVGRCRRPDGAIETFCMSLDGTTAGKPTMLAFPRPRPSAMRLFGLRPDGDRLLVAGTTDTTIVVCAYRSDGTTDTSFGSDGVFVLSDMPNAVLTGFLHTRGGYLLTGHAGFKGFLAEITPTGIIDPSFGQNGIALAPEEVRPCEITSAAIDGTDRIVVLAAPFEPAERYSGFLALRYGSSGHIDTSFGVAGCAWAEINGTTQPNALALQDDDGIVMLGNIHDLRIFSTAMMGRFVNTTRSA